MNQRFMTREVMVGRVGVGGSNPVRVQSMTNTSTMDTDATVRQAIQLYQAGCELVRITAPGVKEAANLAAIKQVLRQQGYDIPLIADIHFSPKAAEVAAAIVEKIRINPGNYTGAEPRNINYSPQQYQAALDKVRQNISPLIKICKAHNTALRIGSNHGSLGRRIIHRYGNTPEGMVEAALEFVRICREMDFHQIVLSMKASNVRVMVHATRLLVKKMMDEGMDYPVHLGVTEAGDGTEGRVKSAVGIGTLLAHGIGDTIRVSLTEDPVNEVPVAQRIINYIKPEKKVLVKNVFKDFFYDPYSYNPRFSKRTKLMPAIAEPLVLAEAGEYIFEKPDIIINPNQPVQKLWHHVSVNEITSDDADYHQPVMAISQEAPAVHSFRKFFETLHHNESRVPVILHKTYSGDAATAAIPAAIDFGPLFLDGLGDGIWLDSDEEHRQSFVSLAYTLLQACGARITKTEFIACPSCGRTRYDIQASLQKVKAATGHLKGLKIAVMGCIVNGPGEMADADYGYVGMGTGKVALYRGRTQVQHDVAETEAVASLVQMIKNDGRWGERKE
jgi:(E)-4-hydroxy-3-methylbut-2-enyl-diphosphate synthase